MEIKISNKSIYVLIVILFALGITNLINGQYGKAAVFFGIVSAYTAVVSIMILMQKESNNNDTHKHQNH